MPRARLKPIYERLIDYYFGKANFDKTKATRYAGFAYPNKYANVLFNKPQIKAEIERRQKKMQDKYEVNYDKIMRELAKVAYSNLADFMTFDEDTGEFVALSLNKEQLEEISALGEVTIETYVEGNGEDAEMVKHVRFKPYNKLTALDSLVRHAGLSKDKLKVEGEMSIVEKLRAGRNRTQNDTGAEGQPAGHDPAADD